LAHAQQREVHNVAVRIRRMGTRMRLLLCLVIGLYVVGVASADDGTGEDSFADDFDAALNAGEYDQAFALVQSALEAEPRNPMHYFDRGLVNLIMARGDDAVRDFGTAYTLDPTYDVALYLRGYTYQWMQRYDLALADYTELVALAADDPSQRHHLASLYIDMGKADAALPILHELTQLYPTQTHIFVTLLRATRQAQDAPPEAAAQMVTALDAWLLDDAYYRVERGKFHEGQGDYAAALSDFDAAIALFPDDWGFVYQRGWYFYRRGDSAAALDDLNAALDAMPTYVPALWLRGSIQREQGAIHAAIADHEQVIALWGESPLGYAALADDYAALGADVIAAAYRARSEALAGVFALYRPDTGV